MLASAAKSCNYTIWFTKMLSIDGHLNTGSVQCMFERNIHYCSKVWGQYDFFHSLSMQLTI